MRVEAKEDYGGTRNSMAHRFVLLAKRIRRSIHLTRSEPGTLLRLANSIARLLTWIVGIIIVLLTLSSFLTEEVSKILKFIDLRLLTISAKMFAVVLSLYCFLFFCDVASRFKDTIVPSLQKRFPNLKTNSSTAKYAILHSLPNATVGCAIEMFAHPYLDRRLEDNGWATGDIEIIDSKLNFHITMELNYVPQKMSNDSIKYCLSKYEFPFSDASEKLQLEVSRTKWNVLRNVVPSIVANETLRHKLISIFPSDHKVPHSFCLHVVCLTSDNRFLALERSRNTWYHPGAFSVSFEEQLSYHDFEVKDCLPAESWFRRTLCEEVFPLVGPYDKKPEEIWAAVNQSVEFMRVWSCFLEEDTGNVSLMGVARLHLTVDELVQKCSKLENQFNSKRDDEGRLYFMDVGEVEGLILSGHSTATNLFGSRAERKIIEKVHPTSLYRLSMVYRCLID
jgi:hypothetical protein